MSRYSLFERCIGFFLGLIIANQSIRSISYYNYILIYFFILALLVFVFYFGKKNKPTLNLYVTEQVLCVFYAFLITYACFTLSITGFSNLSLLFDLLSLAFIFILGRTISFSTYKVTIYVIFAIGLLHSLTIIFFRDYAYSSGVNYLLMSLMIALFTCYSLIAVFSYPNVSGKLLCFLMYLIGWGALFSMQSRATFIFVALSSLIIPSLMLRGNGRWFFNFFTLGFAFLLGSYYLSEIINFYEGANISERMDSLFTNFQHEQRFTTYGLFFKGLHSFYISGFGIGGTTNGIYSSTIEKYPHNFILEFWSEFGLIGLIFSTYILSLSVFSFFKLLRDSDNFWRISILFLYLYYTMNFMKSFSIYDSSVLFFSFGLIMNKGLVEYTNTSYLQRKANK